MTPRLPRLVSVTYYALTGRLRFSDDSINPSAERDLRDMLRYDGAYVTTGFADVVAFPRFRTAEGTSSGRPTEGRWRSFGFTLTPLKGAPEGFQQFRPGGGWVTYRHPVTSDGPRDYTTLEAVPAEFRW